MIVTFDDVDFVSVPDVPHTLIEGVRALDEYVPYAEYPRTVIIDFEESTTVRVLEHDPNWDNPNRVERFDTITVPQTGDPDMDFQQLLNAVQQEVDAYQQVDFDEQAAAARLNALLPLLQQAREARQQKATNASALISLVEGILTSEGISLP